LASKEEKFLLRSVLQTLKFLQIECPMKETVSMGHEGSPPRPKEKQKKETLV